MDLNDRESLEARRATPKDFGAHLRAVGWVVVIFVVVFTAFNLIEFRQHMKAMHPGFEASRGERLTRSPLREPALRSLQWEVLIVAVGLGVWLFAARRHKAKIQQQLKERT